LTVAGVRLTSATLVTLAVCGGVGVVLYFFFKSTLTGRRIRATADDPVLSRITGVEVRRTTLAVWVLASALAGVGGVLLGISGALSPEMGWNFLLAAFAAAILGGLGSTSAAIVGGLAIGLAQQFAVLVVPVAYKPAVAFVLMVLVLLVRPTGLFAAKARA
jgi:branched-chain amino acid transport system permease protein